MFGSKSDGLQGDAGNASGDGPRETILLVEDEPAVRQLFGQALSERVPRFGSLVDDEQARVVGVAAGALLGAWALRALGAGAGASVGRGLSLSFFDPLPAT